MAIRQISKLAGWLLLFLIIVLSVVPAEDRPVTALPHDLEHFGIFIAAGAAFGLGYAEFVILSFALVGFSAAVEMLQIFMPGRHARLSDFVVDACSIWFGVVLGALISRRWLARK
jgi:VanZ family protein